MSLIESHTVGTVGTLGTNEAVLDVRAGDIAESLNMTPQAVGGIIKTLGLQTRQQRIDGKVKRLLVYDKAKLDTLKRRYILPDDVSTVPCVPSLWDSIQKVDTTTSSECYKAEGRCLIRFNNETNFSCIYSPESCQYFRADKWNKGVTGVNLRGKK